MTPTIKKFKARLKNLNESTVLPWVKKYKEKLKEEVKRGGSSTFTRTISNVRDTTFGQ